MNVTCKRDDLAPALEAALRGTAKRTTLPILSHVLLRAEGDGQDAALTVTGTDLETAVSVKVPAQVNRAGAVTVPGRTLGDLVAGFPSDGEVKMECASGTTLGVWCARNEAHVKGIAAEEYPAIPAFPEGGRAALGSEFFGQAVEQVTCAVATEESRPVLTGVCVRAEASGDDHSALTLAAADVFRLSVLQARTGRLEALEGSKADLIVPSRSIKEAARAARHGGDVEIGVEGGERGWLRAFFRCGPTTVVSQLLEGAYPDYTQIVPKEWSTRVEVATAALLQAVKLARVFSRGANEIIRVKVSLDGGEGLLTVSGRGAEVGDQVGEVGAKVEGEPLEIAFMGSYLEDALKSLRTERATLELTTATSPAVFRPVEGADLTHVLMPVSVS